MPVPFVAMSWGSDILLEAAGDDAARARALHALSCSDAVICDCRSVSAQIREWLPDTELPFVEIPWGLELDRFRVLTRDSADKIRRDLGWTRDVVLISSRSWESHYRIETLIDAFARVSPELRLRLLLLGDGSRRAAIEQAIDASGVAEASIVPVASMKPICRSGSAPLICMFRPRSPTVPRSLCSKRWRAGCLRLRAIDSVTSNGFEMM
jgi:glycosyltransferase involved in cell wall biosynthesis